MENMIDITLFSVPIPNPNPIPKPACQKYDGETDMTDITAKR